MKRHNPSYIATTLDSLVALGLAVVALAFANNQRVAEGGLVHFLEIRITLWNAIFGVAFTVGWKRCLNSLGLYRVVFEDLLRPLARSAIACGVMAILLGLFLQVCRVRGPIPIACLVFFVFAFSYTASRVLLCSSQLGWNAEVPDRVIILGSGRRAAKAWRELRVYHHRSKQFLGFVDDCDVESVPPEIAGRFLGSVAGLSTFFLNNAVDEMVLAAPMRSCYESTQLAVSLAEAAGVRVVCLSDTYKLNYSRALRERTDLFFELVPKDDALLDAEALKRLLDILLASASLVLLAPIFLGISIAVAVTTPGPVLLAEERCGYRRRMFRMYKFRTVVHNPDESTRLSVPPELLKPTREVDDAISHIDIDRITTPLGRFLRSTSLDELPQLWNVLNGDMSMVGPRPMTPQDVSRFDAASLMRRFSVRPGLTGMWQIAGRDSFNLDRWIELDFEYIDGWSLGLDLKILAQTLPAVIRRVGTV